MEQVEQQVNATGGIRMNGGGAAPAAAIPLPPGSRGCQLQQPLLAGASPRRRGSGGTNPHGPAPPLPPAAAAVALVKRVGRAAEAASAFTAALSSRKAASPAAMARATCERRGICSRAGPGRWGAKEGQVDG